MSEKAGGDLIATLDEIEKRLRSTGNTGKE